MRYDLVIKNGYIYNNGLVLKKDIGIKKGVIIKIDDNINDSKNIIDAKDNIIMPGFINTHIHFGEFYNKGYQKKLKTDEYINYAEKFYELNIKNSEIIRVTSSKICAYEAIKYGQTTLMGIRGWNSVEEYKARLYMGYPLMNSGKLNKYLIDGFRQFKSLKNDKLNTYYIFVHSLLSVDEKVLQELSSFVKNNSVYLAIHLKETKNEEKKIIKKYNLNSLEVLEKFNLLSEKTLLVHCCYLNREDIKIIKKYNCTISINPNSNLKLRNKILDITKLKGINICVGTDGIATNDSLNIIECLKTMGLLYNISSKDLIKMITENPGKFLNNKTGRICEGYKADLIIYDLNNYKIVRKETFINNLIYSSEIIPKHVIVDGQYVLKDYVNVLYSDKDINKYNVSDKLTFIDNQ